MAQDLRDLFNEEHIDSKNIQMSEGHQSRFLEKLNSELPAKKSTNKFFISRIAAGLVVLLGLAFGIFQMINSPHIDIKEDTVVSNNKSISDFSPELGKVEDYYLASINLEISKLKLTPSNKELIDGYMLRLKDLDTEYENLLEELNTNGLSDATFDAVISNLKLRLNLVMRLKEKVNEFNDTPFLEETL